MINIIAFFKIAYSVQMHFQLKSIVIITMLLKGNSNLNGQHTLSPFMILFAFDASKTTLYFITIVHSLL